jgi:RimJ/RimL family protein N-acetyltransferase
VDWVDQADRFWASELGHDLGVLGRGGSHIVERADPDAEPRAIVVGTSSVTVLSLPKGRAATFEEAGLSIREMERDPRNYVTSCSSHPSMEVRGPAYLAYWPPSWPPPAPREQTQLFGRIEPASLAALRTVAPEEWEEAGIGSDSQVLGARVEDRIVAVAGYERWSGHLAQLQVFCYPDYRRRGLATDALRAAVRQAVADNLLPQYRARDGNRASRALAARFGFVEYGWMATVLLRTDRFEP